MFFTLVYFRHMAMNDELGNVRSSASPTCEPFKERRFSRILSSVFFFAKVIMIVGLDE